MSDRAETEMAQAGKDRRRPVWLVPAALFAVGVLAAWAVALALAFSWLGRMGWHAIFG